MFGRGSSASDSEHWLDANRIVLNSLRPLVGAAGTGAVLASLFVNLG